MARDLPLISSVEAKELAMLDEKPGRIGECMKGQSWRLRIKEEGQFKSGRLCSLLE